MESLGLSEKDAQSRINGEEELRGNEEKVHLEKWPLKWSVCVHYRSA